MLVAGFGMLAKLKLGFTTWTYMKLGTWLAVAASPGLIKRAPFRKPLMSLIILAIGLFEFTQLFTNKKRALRLFFYLVVSITSAFSITIS